MSDFKIIAGMCEHCGRKPEKPGEPECYIQNHAGVLDEKFKQRTYEEHLNSAPEGVRESLQEEHEVFMKEQGPIYGGDETESNEGETSSVNEESDVDMIDVDNASRDELVKELTEQGFSEGLIASFDDERMRDILAGEDEEYAPGEASDIKEVNQ